MLAPIYAIFVEHIGGDILDAGMTSAVFSVSLGIFLLLFSWMENRLDRLDIMIFVGYGIRSFGVLLYLFIQTPAHLLIVQSILGLGGAIALPAYDAIYSKFLDKGKFALEWGVWESFGFISYGIAAFVGAFIAQKFNFQVLFVIMFIISLFSLLTIIKLRKELRRVSNE